MNRIAGTVIPALIAVVQANAVMAGSLPIEPRPSLHRCVIDERTTDYKINTEDVVSWSDCHNFINNCASDVEITVTIPRGPISWDWRHVLSPGENKKICDGEFTGPPGPWIAEELPQ